MTGQSMGDRPGDAESGGEIEETSSPEPGVISDDLEPEVRAFREQAGEQRDQAGERRDQAGERRDAVGDARDQAAGERDGVAALRDADSVQRDQAGEQRDTRGDARDAAAGERDAEAERRDRAARLLHAPVGEPVTTELLAHSVRLREAAASDRSRAAEDRYAAAGERDEAQHDRGAAGADRLAGAGERVNARLDRDSALDDRKAGAGERGNAWLDRDTAQADRGAAAVELEHSSHDALTGAYLRGAGFAELEREILRAQRERQPLALAFVDVDGLKAANDTHGHAAGDRMLRAVADALRAKLRAHDLIIRYGGDEFVCAIAGLGAAAAATRLGLVNVALGRLPERASVTVGIAELRAGDSADALVSRADAALYADRQRR